MRRFCLRHILVATCSFLIFLASHAQAAGTPAGTVITNQATVSVVVNGALFPAVSNIETFIVDEVLDLTLTWQDSGNITVLPGDQDRMLTFLLTNTGNGDEAFTIDWVSGLPTDQFTPENPELILDSNGNGVYDDGVDEAYDPASPPALAADEALTLFLFNDIPGDPGGPLNDELGSSQLTAEAVTGSGPPGTVFSPATPADLAVIVGSSGALQSATGIYQASRTKVTLTKSATVDAPDGSDDPVVGATVTYSIHVQVEDVPATGLVVRDVIPENTTYVSGSLRLTQGSSTQTLTDSGDTDAGTYMENPPGSGTFEVLFDLGDLDNTTRTVSFQVTID